MYDEQKPALVGASTLGRTSLKEGTLNQKIELEQCLKEIDEAIEILDRILEND